MVGFFFSWWFCSSGDIYPIKEGGFRSVGHATSHDALLQTGNPFAFLLKPFELKGWEGAKGRPLLGNS